MGIANSQGLNSEAAGDRVERFQTHQTTTLSPFFATRWLLLALLWPTPLMATPPRLELPARQPNGWTLLQGRASTNQAIELQASLDLAHWHSIALLDARVRNPNTDAISATNQTFSFLEPAATSESRRFYRFLSSELTGTNDWKSQILFPNDALASMAGSAGSGDTVRWVKFSVLLNDPTRVYFQASDKYVLHYDFASTRLPAFLGLSRAAFDNLSLFTNGQQVLLGTVLFPPKSETREYAVQFAGRDPLPAAMICRSFELVRSTVAAGSDVVPFYFPSYEQGPAAVLESDRFRAAGIRVSSVNRWVQSDQVYASGWALGRVRFIPAEQIQAAYLDGRLLPSDVLVTDGIPAEVPFVAGIVSFSPATPNSHVAILAGSYGVPFAYLSDPGDQVRVQALDGQSAVLQAETRDGYGEVLLLPAQDRVDAALEAELAALKSAAIPHINSKARYGAISAATDALTPDDIRFFGGKAANYGLLRREVPDHSQPAIAFSFDLWEAFMDQELPTGKTLRDSIRERLVRHTYPPAMAPFTADLQQIRDWITQTAHFTSQQQGEILQALASFDPQRKIRFRSSSNAEDCESFTAAGLYDSFSGCPADDLDNDNDGPCHCDSTEPHERGVFRAIQKVYASFYNDNAVLERLRRRIDEAQLAMGVLVHYSTPDELELANGVARVWQETSAFGPTPLRASLVTQLGAQSVANPEGNAKPEVVTATELGVNLEQSSSLVPLGSRVMNWTADYDALSALLFQVYRNYQPPSGAVPPTATILDLEYKKTAPGELYLKQVRQLPSPATNTLPRYLLNEPTTYWVYQSESSDALANHRLKCFLTLQNANVRLEGTNPIQILYTEAHFQFRIGTNLLTQSGALSNWPGATHFVTHQEGLGTILQDSWSDGAPPDQRRFELSSVPPPASVGDGPFVQQAELRKTLKVTYSTPILPLGGGRGSITEEEVQLVTCPPLESLKAEAPESFATTNGLQFEVSFLVSTNTTGPPMGIEKNFWGTYPAALSPWMQTRIKGLTTEPFELRGYWSQSAKAGHKYRYASYVFEPQLEPGLPDSVLQELRQADIQIIYVERETWPGGQVTVQTIGFDGRAHTSPPAPRRAQASATAL